ncbi:MAG: isoprenylcysteine carboxylmethyltransferase family protein [Anaerolineales bacterium]
MLETVIFLLGSIGFIILSRQSLINPSSHGFPRFIAFEGILGLVVLNAHLWFSQPFSISQMISWTLLLISAFLAINAFWVLRKYGKADHSIRDDSRTEFEKTTRLVTNGPYQFIRHPLYASLLGLAWGIFLNHISPLSGALVVLVSLTLFLTAIYEERENLRSFGEEYASYMRHTRRFIPFLF